MSVDKRYVIHVKEKMNPLDLLSLELTPSVFVTGWNEWLRLIVW